LLKELVPMVGGEGLGLCSATKLLRITCDV